MFTKIGLKNFKCFESVEIAPRLITVLIGANGTGKSSLIQALVLVKQSTGQPSLALNGDWLMLGEFKEVTRRGGPAWVDIHYSASTEVAGSEPIPSGLESVTIDCETRVIAGSIHKMTFTMDSQGILDGQPIQHSFRGQYEAGLPRQDCGQVQLRESRATLQPHNAFAHPLMVSRGQNPDPVDYQKVTRYAQAIIEAVPKVFQQVFLVPASRGVDLPQYPLGGRSMVEFSNLRGSMEQASALLTTLLLEHRVEEQVSRWFEEALRVKVRARNRPDQQVALEITFADAAAAFDNAVNQGYGYGPLVFVLAQLALAPPGSTICIEEPEIHLHPKAQAEVTAVMARAAKRENKQLILATHSEHILVKLLNLVAQGELAQDELAVYYFEKDAQGIARAEELKVGADGTLEGGLKGFFEQDLAEMEEFLLASKKKQ